MKASSAQPNNSRRAVGLFSSGPELELPDDPGFASESPRLSGDALFRLNQSQWPFFNSRPGAEEQRLREKCSVPFEL
ncbi:MAG: hypothetical protein JWR19_221 [Pedosphaera sp.]|nr:hypothetical protein [Pedosphaera sp.]